jgi:hypothetical protein
MPRRLRPLGSLTPNNLSERHFVPENPGILRVFGAEFILESGTAPFLL